MTKLKICGLTRLEDALVCADRGADFLGFIFVPDSPRFVEPEKAAEIVSALRDRVEPPRIVGVFRDASVDYIRELAALVSLDFVQLHGAESEDDVQLLGVPSIKAFRVGDVLPETDAIPSADWILFDTYDDRRGGGTGRRFDWSLLAHYPRTRPFFLSGGINAENAAAAISLVRPDALDVASGVESAPGIKDRDKIDALFDRMKRA